MHVFSEVMRVRVDREEINVDGEREFVGDKKIFLTGRNVEPAIVFQLQKHGVKCCRLVRQVQPKTGLDGFLFSGRLQVNVENEVRVFVQAERHAIGLGLGHGAGLPEKEVAVWIKGFGFDFDFHAGETRSRLCFLASRGLPAVHQNIGMVDDAFITRANLDSFQPACAIERSAKDEIPIHVRAACREHEGFVRLDDLVWLSKLPARDESWCRWEIGGIAFIVSLLDPFLKEGDLLGGEAKFAGKFQFTRLGQPRRHEMSLRNRGDLPGMGFCVLVRKQREGSGLSSTVAHGTRVEENRCDVAVESDSRPCGSGKPCGS